MSVFILLFMGIHAGVVFAGEKKPEVGGVSKDSSHIEFKEDSHDFGEVMQAAKLKHTFTFDNTGKRKLVIEKVKAG
jgi:hypothetical protein